MVEHAAGNRMPQASRIRALARGFTLVEVLVVVAIVALLASLAYPFLRKAMDTAKKVKCLANLKMLSGSCLAYAADNEGYLPANGPLSDGSDGTRHVTAWVSYNNQMTDYGLKWPNKTTLCPSEDQAFCLATGRRTSYAIPGPLSPGSRFCGATYGNSGPFPRIHTLEYPSKVILLWEYFGRHYGDPSGMTTAGGKAGPTHNVVFLDGHVGTFKSDTTWMNLETMWRNYGIGGAASLPERRHVP